MKHLKTFNEHFIFESVEESIDYSKLFKKDMEFHDIKGKLVGKIIQLYLTPNFCTTCGEKLKTASKFCTACGKKVNNVVYKNFVDGETYGFGIEEFYNKLKQAGWNKGVEQTIKDPDEIEVQKNTTINKENKKESSTNSEFDKLCVQYSKMKGANLEQLELVKNMADKEKQDFVKIAMIKRLMDNLKD